MAKSNTHLIDMLMNCLTKAQMQRLEHHLENKTKLIWGEEKLTEYDFDADEGAMSLVVMATSKKMPKSITPSRAVVNLVDKLVVYQEVHDMFEETATATEGEVKQSMRVAVRRFNKQVAAESEETTTKVESQQTDSEVGGTTATAKKKTTGSKKSTGGKRTRKPKRASAA